MFYVNFCIRTFFVLLLSGCQVGPRYQAPETHVPESWKASAPEVQERAEVSAWWEVFEDPTLDELEELALENSPTLYIALQKVWEARALAGVSGSALFPQIALAPNYSQTDMLFKIFLPPNAFPGEATFPKVFRINQFQYVLPVNISYELDLWGKICNQYRSARLHAKAQEEALITAMLMLTTQLATDYFQLRALDSQIALLEETLELRRKGLALTERRNKSGLVPSLDVTEAETSFFNVESDYQELLAQRARQENALALLVGVPASEFCLAAQGLFSSPPQIPSGLPSDLLLQRPDIAEAERTMAAEHAQIGVAYASFWPALNLTSALGFSSPDLRQFLSWQSRLFMLGVDVLQTVFDGGKNCANLAATQARFQQAVGNYQQQVLVAFQEVEDALSNLERQSLQFGSLERAVRSAEQSERLVLDRYMKGLSNYLDVVTIQETALETKRTLLNLQGLRYLSTVQLIKALGGSWLVI